MSGDLRDALTADLRAAMRSGDRRLVAVLRSTLAAIDNAEAVDPASLPHDSGATEVERGALDGEAVRRIVMGEREEIMTAAGELREHGRMDDARELDRRAAILRGYASWTPRFPRAAPSNTNRISGRQ